MDPQWKRASQHTCECDSRGKCQGGSLTARKHWARVAVQGLVKATGGVLGRACTCKKLSALLDFTPILTSESTC